MASLKELAALIDSSAPDEWYVTDGVTAVGPVEIELLARGIAAGKVPADAFVRHASWEGWRNIGDLAEQAPSFDPRRTFRVLPAAKAEPPRETLPSIDVVDDSDVVSVAKDLGAVFATASDLREALLLLLASVVQAVEADAALIHDASDEGGTVVCSHGPRMFELLGDKLPNSDPVLFAAKQGHTLLAEPVSGVGGRAIKARLSRLGARVDFAFMVPILVEGRLLSFVEAGRNKPLSARDVAGIEHLVETLVDTVKRMKWSREWKGSPSTPKPPRP